MRFFIMWGMNSNIIRFLEYGIQVCETYSDFFRCIYRKIWIISNDIHGERFCPADNLTPDASQTDYTEFFAANLNTHEVFFLPFTFPHRVSRLRNVT